MPDTRFVATAAFDRRLFWESGASVRYLVARLRASREDELRIVERSPLNIALVIDASGSMSGGKLEAAKAAALGLVERLTEQDRLTLVSFASDVQVHLDAVLVSRENLSRIRNEVSLLQTRGMTNLSEGWFTGVKCAARIAEEDARLTARVIILSDGLANEGIVDRVELQEHAGELRLRGVLTSALGIGNDYDELLLRGIAENGGGRLHDAEFTSEISSVLLGEIDDIFDTVMQDVQVSLSVPFGVHVDLVGPGVIKVRNGRLVAPVGILQNDIARTVVFKVTFPEVKRGDELRFGVVASGHSVDTRTRRETGELFVSAVAADSHANDVQPRDAEIAEVVARTWSAQVVLAVAKLNRDGAYWDAQAYVERELHHFRRYVHGLAGSQEMVRELELLARHAEQSLSPRMSKEMIVQSTLYMERREDHRGVKKEGWAERMGRGE